MVFAQSGKATTKLQLDLGAHKFADEIAYPHSNTPSGVSVLNSQYWFDEIAKANDSRGIG